MKLIDIIKQKYETDEGREIIRNTLLLIPPLSKHSDEDEIPIEMLEKAIRVMCKKYKVRIRDITPDISSAESDIIWRLTVLHETDLSILSIVYGLTTYEVMAKATIVIYSMVKGGLEKRKDD